MRATVVTGMPASRVRSSGRMVVLRTRIPSRERRSLGALTSTFAGDPSLIPHRAAAERWLSTASGPQASTAAIHTPGRDRPLRPTA